MVEVLCKLAKEAGEMFKEGFDANKEITYKSEIDLVTQYDLNIELFLKKRLQEECSGFTIVGEETGGDKLVYEKTIYIDPIDGTTNFVHGLKQCAISIGAYIEGVPYAGVVYNPITEELFSAQQGKGAFCNDQKLQVSTTDSLQSALLATGFPYTKLERGKDYEWVMQTLGKILPASRDIRRLGSAALDLCYVAKGHFDGYYELNLKPWDMAAGILMVTEAGGTISCKEGNTFNFDKKVLVASNGKIHNALIEKMA